MNITIDGGSLPVHHQGMDNDALTRHLRHLAMEGKSPVTIRHRELGIARLAAALPVPVLNATPADLERWRESLDGLAPRTIVVYASHVRAYYAWAVKRRLIAENPAADLPVPKPGRPVPHPIGEKDLLHALAHAQQPIRLWIVLGGWGGFRCKEIAFLRADCIRLEGANPHVRIAEDATKGHAEGTVPLSDFVVAELRRAAQAYPPVLFTTGWVFQSAAGGPFTPNFVSKQCNGFLRSMGIPDVFHSLRHRFVSQAYAAGHDIRAAQELARHKTIQTTAGYAAVNSVTLARTVNAIPAPGEREAS